MNHFIVVREDGPGKFTAYPAGLPELTVVAGTHPAAVLAARENFVRWVKEGKLVSVNVTVPFEHLQPPPPLDPIHEELQQEFIRELAEQRRREDAEDEIWKCDPGESKRRQEIIETIQYRQENLKGTIWDYEIPWPDSSSTPTTSPISASATPVSPPELPRSSPEKSLSESST